MPKPPKPLTAFGPPGRGIQPSDVERAADALLREGERPTIEKVRAKLGTGSPNTINPLLDAWWRKLSQRLDAGPAALHRLPEFVALAAEALWLQALDEGRRRASQEQRSVGRALAIDKQQLEVRSHVLSLREGELVAQLREREREHAALESRLRELTTLLRKEQAVRESQARRISEMESEPPRRARVKTKLARPAVTAAPEQRSGSRRTARHTQAAKPGSPRKSKNNARAGRRRRR